MDPITSLITALVGGGTSAAFPLLNILMGATFAAVIAFGLWVSLELTDIARQVRGDSK